jgi:hypothetical protein
VANSDVADASEKRKRLSDQKEINFCRVSSVHAVSMVFVICVVGDFTMRAPNA